MMRMLDLFGLVHALENLKKTRDSPSPGKNVPKYIPTEFVRLSLDWVHSITLCTLGHIMQYFN